MTEKFTAPKRAAPDYCAVYPEDYRGQARWSVTHPAKKRPVTVAAPNNVSAIVAAATYWKMDWTRADYYMDAVAVKK